MADYEVVNGVAVLTCQNPPVNQLSYKLRLGLLNGLEQSIKDPEVKALVIVGGGRTFPAGADVKEFATGEAFKRPLTELIDKIEACPKPVVAAIHGTALGGGLEVALGCHYRIGTSRSKVGLPEVLLGILPGAGGTQRLPRVIGCMLAAELIASGQHINAERAKKINILDDVVHIEDNHGITMEQLIIRQYGIRYAINIANRNLDDRIISKRKVAPVNEFFYDQIRLMTSKRARGFIAPELCIEAVKASSDSKTFEDGMKKERELLMKLAQNSQSQALQHIFFAEREISKVPGINPNLAIKINLVGIVGCGTMGGGILMNFVQKEIPVIVLETKQEYLDKGLKIIKDNWTRQVKSGKITAKTLEKYMSLITPTLSYDSFKDCDIVIEAVFENMKIKHQVFKQLDRVCKKNAILASNTSFLNIDEVASVTSRPEKVIGTHFFAPANQMQLLENVRGKQSDDIAIATVQEMAKVIKKKGVLVGNCEGFVGNRCFAVYSCEAQCLIEDGCLPQDVDRVLYKFGWAMGPFQVSDLSGNDIGYRHREEKGWVKNVESRPKGRYPFTIADKLVELGRLGQKNWSWIL